MGRHRIGEAQRAGGLVWTLMALLAVLFGPRILRSSLLQGDLPGHLEMVRWSMAHLWPLPWGWDPRYLGGAPIGILYPPLLAWVGGGLALLVGAEPALRALLLFSVVALPPCLYRAGRGLGLRRREATWAMLAGLALLWIPSPGLGGSLRQTLIAGNAANGLVLPLFLLYLGRVRIAVGRPGRVAGCATLLALVLLGHLLLGAVSGLALVGYTLMRWWRGGPAALARGSKVALLGLLGASPFLLPFVLHMKDASPDGIPFNPPPGVAEWLALIGLILASVLGGRPGRRVLLPPLILLIGLYLLRGIVFPFFGGPDIRMEFHRFRLFLYLALVPSGFFLLRTRPGLRRLRKPLMAGLVLLLAYLVVFLRYEAVGPVPLPAPGIVPDLSGQRMLVLSSPASQNGSWNGAQIGLPTIFGASGAKGVFVESSPLSQRVFELERLASSPGSRPHWWAIRTAPLEEIRTWPREEAARRFRELGVGWVLAREPVSSMVEKLSVEPPIDLGGEHTLYRLPPAPLVRPGRDGETREDVEFRISGDGSRIELDLGREGARTVILAVSAFSDWRIDGGEGTLRRIPPGLLEVGGQGRVLLIVAPRWEEWLGLALGGIGVLGILVSAGRRRRRAQRWRFPQFM